MKAYKLTLILVFLLLFTVMMEKVYAQNEYYDAVAIAKSLDRNGNFGPKQFTVLHKYFTGKTDNQIATDLSNNPFLKAYFNAASLATVQDDYLKNATNLSSIGNLNVTNFSDGIAQFLIERGKEEIEVAFFQRMQAFTKRYPEVKIIFPSTANFINSIDSYNYSAMLPALRAAFQKDMNSLTSDLVNLRSPSNYAGYSTDTAIKKRADKICAFLNTTLPGRSGIVALIVANGITKGNNAADIINQLSSDPITDPKTADDIFSNSIQFVNVISQSLRSSDQGEIWITRQQINDFVKDNNALQIYLGLLYAHDQNNTHHIQFVLTKTTITLQTFLANLKSKWSSASSTFIQTFTEMANAASDIADNSKNISDVKKQGDQASILTYANYVSSISGFLKLSMSLLPNNSGVQSELAEIGGAVSKFNAIIDDAGNSYYYIKSQNYGALVLSTSSIVAEIVGANYPFKNDYITYGTFMADIIEAKNSSEVQSAIEAVALPAGSYSVKQKSKYNISLNGYIGYAADINQGHGVTAPVGFSGTLGSKKGVPITLFIGLIDVGSFVSYRLNNGTTDQIKQQVTLESIIAPSAQIFFEIPKWPVAIGGGVRMTPKVSYSTATNTTSTVSSKVAATVSILIDIPFFTLHNTTF
jgi:hypothetical protein